MAIALITALRLVTSTWYFPWRVGLKAILSVAVIRWSSSWSGSGGVVILTGVELNLVWPGASSI